MALQFDPAYNRRKRRLQWTVFGLFRLLSYAIALVLFVILGFIIVKGISVVNWTFLTETPTDGMTGGGIWPAIVGTFYLMLGSALFAFPVGVVSGIYMSEYAPGGKLVAFIRTMTNNLAGIPSIVFGLFGMAFFVTYLDFGDSILAGSLTLGLLALPIVIRTTEEAFRDIAPAYREGSLALGATKAQTIWHVLLPMAMPRVPCRAWSRASSSRWAASRARRPPSSSPARPTSCPSCRRASSTSAWPCPTTSTSWPPAAPTSRPRCPLPTARRSFSSSLCS